MHIYYMVWSLFIDDPDLVHIHWGYSAKHCFWLMRPSLWLSHLENCIMWLPPPNDVLKSFLLDMFLLHSPGWLRTHYVDKVGLEQQSFCHCNLSTGIRDMSHHTQLPQSLVSTHISRTLCHILMYKGNHMRILTRSCRKMGQHFTCLLLWMISF